MLLSAFSALVVSVLPNHKSPFLFSNTREVRLSIDKIITYLICIWIWIYSLILTVFGLASIVFGLRDLSRLKNVKRLRKGWLKLHLGSNRCCKCVFVVNQILPSVWNWFVPTLVGSIYIAYWTKLNKKGFNKLAKNWFKPILKIIFMGNYRNSQDFMQRKLLD